MYNIQPVDFDPEISEEVDFDFVQSDGNRLGPRKLVRLTCVVAHVNREVSADAITRQNVVTETLEVVQRSVERPIVWITKDRTHGVICNQHMTLMFSFYRANAVAARYGLACWVLFVN